MIKEEKIENFGSYVELVSQITEEQQYRMWYRGQAMYEWGLIPSIQRRKEKSEHDEQYISTNFMIQTKRLNYCNVPRTYDRAGWLALMQHYGLPTRLLDWSESPLVALYFALREIKDSDASVWVLNPMKLNVKMGYGEYVPPMDYDSLKGDFDGAFSDETEDEITKKKRIVACHGIGNDLRMYVQQSNFTIHSSKEKLDEILSKDNTCDYLYKICIPQQVKWKMRDQLDIVGFRESTIYPDMEHIACEQKGEHLNF